MGKRHLGGGSKRERDSRRSGGAGSCTEGVEGRGGGRG